VSIAALVLVVPLTAVYGIITVPVLMLLLFAIEGSVQALGVPAAQSVVAQAAPVGRAAAAQGLAGAMNLLGATVSAFSAPAIYEAWGPVATFSIAGAIVAVATAAAVVLQRGNTTASVTVISG
jgi:predicted MFS family arabinose efflux permease